MAMQPQRHETTEAQRAEIVGQHKRGGSFASIGRNLGLNSDTVRKVWNRYQNEQRVMSAP